MARDILPFEFGGGGESDGGRRSSKSCSRPSKYDVVGDIFFGKDDMKEYVWDEAFTEETVRFIERESAMKALRKRSKRRRPETFSCLEFLKFVWCFKF